MQELWIRILNGVVTGFETRYPRIWHRSMLNILSQRNLRNGRCWKDSGACPEAGHKALL